MTNKELRGLWLRIGAEMGWRSYTKQGRQLTTYSIRLFERDLELLHPGLWRGASDRLRRCVIGRYRVPGYLDGPVRELLERAVAGRWDPPVRGKLWVPPGLERSVGTPAGAALLARNLMAWRQVLDVSIAEIEAESMRVGGPVLTIYRLVNIERLRGPAPRPEEIRLLEELLVRLRGVPVDLRRSGPAPPQSGPDPATPL